MVEAVEFLKRIKKIDVLIENKIKELEQWECIATNITSFVGGERVQSSPKQQKMADAVCQCIDIKNEIAESIVKLRSEKNIVISVIERLEPQEYDLLHKIYIQHLPFVEAANRCNVSKRKAADIHSKAIGEVQKILDREFRD